MTPIRPAATAPQSTVAPGSNSTAAARAAFFQALGGAGQAAPVAPVAAAPAPRNTVTAAPPQTNAGEPPARPLRPGSLLDIRV